MPGKAGQKIEIAGTSVLRYDERVLPTEEAGGGAVLRIYRDVNFSRTSAGETQKQEIRPAVRRMVVMRSAEGKKAPFSPDGPLTFGEIDAVRFQIGVIRVLESLSSDACRADQTDQVKAVPVI